ncbi:MAG: inosine/xanthosine triphosphatase [Sphaerobacter sp.]|nr:inosine/xanthosine triphosphatase [Sphaerobacter sp.]
MSSGPRRCPHADAPLVIASGSVNPAKHAAVERAAAAYFLRATVEAVDVPSGVPAQPWGDEETARGALRRAAQARLTLDADLGLGIESGVVEGPGGNLYVVAWAAAIDRDDAHAFGGSERFPLPAEVADRVRAGAELGPVIDAVAGIPGTARRGGAISLLTAGRRDRTDMLTIAVIHALAALLQVWRGGFAQT